MARDCPDLFRHRHSLALSKADPTTMRITHQEFFLGHDHPSPSESLIWSHASTRRRSSTGSVVSTPYGGRPGHLRHGDGHRGRA